MSGRVLRFRVWDTRYNRWEVPPRANSVPRVWFGPDGSLVFSNPVTEQTEVVEQWTGLNDAKGQPIYEGDIISWDGAKAVMRWDDNCARFYFDVIDEALWCDDWSDRLERTHRYEVIGNLHETSHLLTPAAPANPSQPPTS